MKIKILSFFILVGGCLLQSCQKDSDIFFPDLVTTGLDTNWVTTITSNLNVSLLKASIGDGPHTDSVEALGGGTCQFQDLSITLPPQACVLPSGGTPTGRIHVEAILITKKGDMVRMDKPTTSFGRLLISGGQVFVSLSKDGQALTLAQGKQLNIRFPDVNVNPLMKLFKGDESVPDRFNWVPLSDTTANMVQVSQSSGFYNIATNNLRWINCDYFADSSGSRVNIAASLPLDYTNGNTMAYIVFRDTRTVIALYGEASLKKFISNAKIPIGKAATMVTITRKGDNSYFLGHESFTTGITSAGGIQTIPLSPQPTSLTDIKSYLNTL